MTTLAVGDVHGCFTLLTEQLKPYLHQGHDLVFLGDLIDRAPEPDGDINVIGMVRDLQDDPAKYGFNSVTVLRGNHENMFCDAVHSHEWGLWRYNGGNIHARQKLIEHLDWLWHLPTYHIKDDYLFVHAGVVPNVDITEQEENDLMWIREGFLDCDDHGLPYRIVHGHTPTRSREVEFHPRRIACDTGSFFSGKIGMIELDC
jgi:serine/threonine protein phosphatase 1